MADFSMTKYYNEYISAETEARNIQQGIDDMRSALPYMPDEEAVLELMELIRSAGEQLRSARAKAEELRSLAYYGKSRDKLAREHTYREIPLFGGGAKPHFPTAKGRRLEH